MTETIMIHPMKHKINAKVSFLQITDPNCIMEIRENDLNSFVRHTIDRNPPLQILFLREDLPESLLQSNHL